MKLKPYAKFKPHHQVVALAYDGLATFEFGCTVELFALNRPELDVDWYKFVVCAVERGLFRATGGIEVRVPNSITWLDRADTIIIPGWRNVDELPSASLLRKIRAAYQRGARFCTICSGVFVLAAAGVLDGKKVTTHWRYAEKLKQRYPSIVVESNALYVDEGQILTSAGSAAGLDMLLHLVRRDYGARVANWLHNDWLFHRIAKAGRRNIFRSPCQATNAIDYPNSWIGCAPTSTSRIRYIHSQNAHR